MRNHTIDKIRHPAGAGLRMRQTTQGLARHLAVGGCGALSDPAQPQSVPGLPGCLCRCRARWGVRTKNAQESLDHYMVRQLVE